MVITTDIVSAAFETFGALLGFCSIRALWKDKQPKGVSLAPSVFFLLWAVYNIFFYKMVDQPISRYAAIGMFLTNTTWLIMALYYKHRPQTDTEGSGASCP